MNFRIVLFLSLFLLVQKHIAAQTEVTLLFVGDAMMHQSQIDAARCDTGYNFDPCFQFVKEEISSADLAIANLESPLGGEPYSGYPVFSSPDIYAKALKDAGFDLLLLANNHILDKRTEGLCRTVSKLNEYGIPSVGVYKNSMDKSVLYPCVINCNGIRLAFLNYTYGTNGFQVQSPALVNYIDKKAISEDIKTVRQLGADAIIACIHWGDEYVLQPNQAQKELANQLVDEGVDLIIGSHPHVLQPMEWRKSPTSDKSSVVVYSLGNFISNMQIRHTRGGAMVKVVLSKQFFCKAKIKSVNYSLVFTQRTPDSGVPNYILLPAARYFDSPENLTPKVQDHLKQYVKDARQLLDKYNVEISEYKF